MYKQLTTCVILIIFVILSCSVKNQEKLIGKWKGISTRTGVSTNMCDISKNGEKLFLDNYTLFNKSSTYIDNVGGSTPKEGIKLEAGATVRHRKAELIFDKGSNVYKWNEGRFIIDVKLLDDERLLLQYPGEQKLYNRVKQ